RANAGRQRSRLWSDHDLGTTPPARLPLAHPNRPRRRHRGGNPLPRPGPGPDPGRDRAPRLGAFGHPRSRLAHRQPDRMEWCPSRLCSRMLSRSGDRPTGWMISRRRKPMPNDLVAYHGGGGMAEDQAERDKLMAQWGKWFQDLGSALVDGGNPVMRAKTITSKGSVSEGGGQNPISGYSVIKANDL